MIGVYVEFANIMETRGKIRRPSLSLLPLNASFNFVLLFVCKLLFMFAFT